MLTAPEWHFMLASLQESLRGNHRETTHSPDMAGINFPALLKLSKTHRILPHLYRHLKETNTLQSLSSENRKDIETEIQNHQKEALKKISLLLKISLLFNEHGIAHLALKGPVLSQHLYKDSFIRMTSDLDLFLSRTNAVKACLLLEENGFYRYCKSGTETDLHEITRQAKDIVFIHRQWNIPVELHFELLPAPFLYQMPWETAWQDRRETELNCQHLFTLSEEMTLFYLCAHGHQHGWERLHWLFDFAVLLSTYSHERISKLFQSARKYRLEREWQTALLLSHCFFGLDLAEDLKNLKDEKLFLNTKLQISFFLSAKSLGRDIGPYKKMAYWRNAVPEKKWLILGFVKNSLYPRWVLRKKPFRFYHLWLVLQIPALVFKKLSGGV